MELRHLRYFLTIARTENVRLAAERLHVTQPALSRQLRDLEQELGVTLFDRLPRGIRLNAAGRAYEREVKRILSELDSAGEYARRIAGGETGRLRLGFLEITSWRGIVPNVLSAFAAAYPDIGLELSSINTPRQLRNILDGKLDGGFVYLFEPLDDRLTGREVHLGNVLLAVPAAWRHRFADRVGSAELQGVPFIGFPREDYPIYFDNLLGACRAAGLSPNIVQSAHYEGAVLSLVSAAIGVAIVNDANLSCPLPQVAYLPLADISIPLRLHFVCRRGHGNPALERFIHLLMQCLDHARQN